MVLSARLAKKSNNFSRPKSFYLPPAWGRCIRFLLAMALIPCCAMAVQSDTEGSISGTVTDQSGAVIPDTTVTALNLDTTRQHSTKTNGDGFYNFTALPVGRYEIEIL